MVYQFLRSLIIAGALLLPGMAHAATTVSVDFSRDTGVAPFDADDAPGNDSGTTNSIIRTNDIISYKFEVLVQGGDATNVLLQLSVDPGLELSLPAFCRETGVTPVSSISGSSAAGYSVLCNVGDINDGSQVLYSMPAKVSGDRAHGSTVSMSGATVQSDQTAQTSFPLATDTVSASPKLDLVKNGHTRLIGRRAGPSGEDGVVYVFPIIVQAGNSGKGNELVTAPISFTDDLSGVSPNARLYQGWTGALADACEPNYGISGFHLWSQIPRGNTRTSDGGPGGPGSGPADWSVWNSGTIDCSVAPPGGTTNVTITGADLSGNHQPTRSANNGGLSASTTFLVAGNMVVWIPVQDINDAGGELSINNVFSALNATSISGQANVEPDSGNNAKSFIARDGGGGRWFYNQLDHNNFGYLPGQTTRRSGDGYVLPEQAFATRHYMYNRNWLSKTPYTNFTFCTSFDNTTQQIKEITPGVGAKIHYSGVYEGGQDPYTIEYGTGTFGATATCDNADSPGGWHTNVNSVPGGLAAITKVRAYTPSFSAPGGSSTQTLTSLIVRHEALDNPVGTYVAQWGAIKYDESNSGNWYFGTPYDETTARGSYGDRLFLTKVSTRVSKDTVPSGDDQVLAGDGLTFKLQPSATTPIDPPNLTTDVTITDTLPVDFEYILSSASPAPNSTTVNPDGTTTLVWQFPGTVINSAMAPITYDVLVKPTVPDQTNAVNTVVASSPNDGSSENVRSDDYGILVLNPSGFSVYKTATPQLIQPNGDYGYTLTYANTGTSDFGGVVMIDVLPDPSVTHSTPTTFTGISNFVAVSGTSGETFEYTKATPSSIVEDPNHASNQSGGATVWCSGYTGGSCPSSASEVTAVRITSPVFPQGQPARSISMQMTALSNGPFDVYSNRFTAQADGLAFPVTAPVATSRVRTSDVSLTKVIVGPSQQPTDIIDFVLTLANDGPHDAEDIVVRDILPAGYTYLGDDAGPNYDPSTGLWQVSALPVDGSTSLTIRARVMPTGPYLNTAEIVGQSYADPDSTADNSASAPGEDDTDSATIYAYLSGNIFIDTGVGGGTAHDGLLSGTETPADVAALSFVLTTTGATLTTTTINADGTWFAVIPEVSVAGPLAITATPNPGYRGISENVATLPALVNPDTTDGTVQFTPSAGASYNTINLGMIPIPTLTQNQSASVQPGQIVELPHRYTATTSGTVAFALAMQAESPAGAFSATIFHDTNCDGVSDTPLTASVPVTAGQAVCLVVRTQAGSGIGPGSNAVYDLSAQTFYSGTGASDVAVNTDTLGSGGAGAGELLLSKRVRNVTAGTAEGTSNSGDIGDTLEYRIIMLNPTSDPMTDVTVHDTVPAYTVLAIPVTTPVVIAPGITCVLDVPTSNVAGYAGPLRWTCPGTFPANAEGSVAFQVTIAP